MQVSELERGMNDILDRVEKHHDKHNEALAVMRDELFELKQRGSAPAGIARKRAESLGAMVVKQVQENADLLGKTGKVRFEIKAASDAVTTDSGRTILSAGVGAPGGMPLGIQAGLPTRGIGSTTLVEYSRYTGVQGAAAVQANEGDSKAAIRPDHTLIEQKGITIAGWAKISKQALNDSAELQRSIDVVLRRSIATVTDSVIVAGSGGWTGLAALGTAYTSLVYTSLADAASEAVATMQEAGFNPDVIGLRPSDWLSLQVAQNAQGDYLAGPYLAPLPELLRGMRVVLSPSVAAGKVHVIDSSQCELLVSDDLAVEIGTDGSDFTKNLRTILGEVRVIPTFRAVGAVRVITPKP